MLGFLFHKKKDEVQRVLHGRVNRAHARSIKADNARGATRGTSAEVVWVIPCDTEETRDADFTRVFAAVTKDLATQGISILNNAAITTPRAIVGLSDDSERRFLLCTVKHCTPLGHGHYHIGLSADEVVRVAEPQIEAMTAILEKADSPEVPEFVGSDACC